MRLGKNYEPIVFENPVLTSHDNRVDKVKKGAKKARHKALFTNYFEVWYERTDRTRTVIINDEIGYNGRETTIQATVFTFTDLRPTKMKYGRLTRRDIKRRTG